jgi:hypothetical protein
MLVRDAIRKVVLKPRVLQVQLLSGTASESVRPSITIASTINPDAAKERYSSTAGRGLPLSRDPLHAQARGQMGAVARSGREASHAIETFTTFLIAMLTETWHSRGKKPSIDRHRKSRSLTPPNQKIINTLPRRSAPCRFTDPIRAPRAPARSIMLITKQVRAKAIKAKCIVYRSSKA